MLDVRYSHLHFYQSLNRLQRGLSAIVELLVLFYNIHGQTRYYNKGIGHLVANFLSCNITKYY